MKRMFKEGCGYHMFSCLIDEAIADGWVEVTEADWKKIIEAKSYVREPVANIQYSATIESQPVRKAGRPRKEMVQPSQG